MNCTNHTHFNGYWSSTLDSRHDCSSSVCCKHGLWVNLLNDELILLRDRFVPICEYTGILQQRDSLHYGVLAMSKFLFCDRTRYDQAIPVLHLFNEASHALPDYGRRGYPPLVLLQAAMMLRK